MKKMISIICIILCIALFTGCEKAVPSNGPEATKTNGATADNSSTSKRETHTTSETQSRTKTQITQSTDFDLTESVRMSLTDEVSRRVHLTRDRLEKIAYCYYEQNIKVNPDSYFIAEVTLNSLGKETELRSDEMQIAHDRVVYIYNALPAYVTVNKIYYIAESMKNDIAEGMTISLMQEHNRLVYHDIINGKEVTDFINNNSLSETGVKYIVAVHDKTHKLKRMADPSAVPTGEYEVIWSDDKWYYDKVNKAYPDEEFNYYCRFAFPQKTGDIFKDVVTSEQVYPILDISYFGTYFKLCEEYLNKKGSVKDISEWGYSDYYQYIVAAIQNAKK